MIYKTFSPKMTKNLAAVFAKEVLKTKLSRGAFVIALQGELGAGKTTFVQGLLRATGVRRRITSPTFLIIKRFICRSKFSAKGGSASGGQIPRPTSHGRSPGGRANSKFTAAYHIDAYRLKQPGELLALGFKEIIADPRNIVLVEWADKIKKILPKNKIRINFKHGKKENERIITMR